MQILNQIIKEEKKILQLERELEEQKDNLLKEKSKICFKLYPEFIKNN